VAAAPGEITQLLASWRDGDRSALDQLVPLIRQELYRIARRHLRRELAGPMVQPSSLVQETFVRLLPDRPRGWHDRAHFFAVASMVMRHLLVDHARQRRREKRGGPAAVHVPLEVAVILSPEQVDEVVAIDLALNRLANVDERKSKVFEMRFFGGLSLEETAEALQISPTTVVRDWRFARAWLRRELTAGGDGSGPLAAD
jgi:RNA polymerase sigma factor (TIGR02999 family)